VREIKFRIRFKGKIVGYEKWERREWLYTKDNISWSNIEILNDGKDQFTGLLDKKKVEGYHKDICQDYKGNKYTIEWDKGVFYLQPVGTTLHWSIQLLEDFEII
jgi:hypothetical protein